MWKLSRTFLFLKKITKKNVFAYTSSHFALTLPLTSGWLEIFRMRAHRSARSAVGHPWRTYCWAAALSCSAKTEKMKQAVNNCNLRFPKFIRLSSSLFFNCYFLSTENRIYTKNNRVLWHFYANEMDIILGYKNKNIKGIKYCIIKIHCISLKCNAFLFSAYVVYHSFLCKQSFGNICFRWCLLYEKNSNIYLTDKTHTCR